VKKEVCAVMKRRGKNPAQTMPRSMFSYMIVVIMVLLIAGSVIFVHAMRQSLGETLALSTLSLTKEGGTAFDANLDDKAESLNNMSKILSKISSDDVKEIKDIVDLYADSEEGGLTVFDMHHDCMYTTARTETQTIAERKLAELNKYGESGWIQPFYSQCDGKVYIACYERFQFTDGFQGIVQRNISTTSLGEQYALSFYDGQGYSYVVDQEGKIIARTQDNKNDRVPDNIFNVISKDGGSKESVEDLEKAVGNQENGVMIFDFEDEPFVFAFCSVGGEENCWSMISMIPEAAIITHLNSIMRTSSLLIAVVIVVIGMALMLMLNRKLLLQDNELRDALEAAKVANRAKTTFLNNMSHDIRTPMNAITGYTALAAKHIDNQEALKDYLSKITESSAHLLALINDVLDMSRIESGKVNINEKEESLSEILHAVRDIVHADINAKQLDFFVDTVDLADENIYCDKLRLNQVLLNIISNSIKYTPAKGYVSLRISELKTSGDGYGTYEFRIKDNGIGMSEDFVKTIFEPFTRERTSTVSGIQGTGLGMSITKNIVDLMGGTIVCNSKMNEGTEFIVTFDFRLQKEHKEIESIPEIENLRGLVVDDDRNACQSITQILSRIGMRTEWCTASKEAIAKTQEAIKTGDRFEVYIIDCMMPEMDGIEVTRRIRQLAGDDVPIIILTAYDWTDIEEEAKEAGVTGFVSKPLFPSDLRAVLMDIYGHTAEEEEEEETEKIDFSGKRVLVVEDNEFNREITSEILGEAGFETETAEDGSIAVGKLLDKGAGYYDLVLMDIQMPIMDGYTATKIIRAFGDKELANIPIIAVSANAFEEDRNRSLKAGMDEHIAKPIDVKQLMDTMVKITHS
jgi:signal transduction histidine kinase/CheY-like chemotaxis protein